jgi:hypothetical protein
MTGLFIKKGRLARSTPNPPCQGLGGELLIAAALRCIQVSSQVGGLLLVIDAKDQRAADGYKSYGALELPKAPLSLVLPYSVFLDVMKQAGKSIW